MITAKDGDMDLGPWHGVGGLYKPKCQGLANRISVSAAADPTDRCSVRKKDRLATGRIRNICFDFKCYQSFAWGAVGELGIGGLAKKIRLVHLDQPVKTHLLWPVFGAVFAAPRAIPFFDPKGQKSAAADRANS